MRIQFFFSYRLIYSAMHHWTIGCHKVCMWGSQVKKYTGKTNALGCIFNMVDSYFCYASIYVSMCDFCISFFFDCMELCNWTYATNEWDQCMVHMVLCRCVVIVVVVVVIIFIIITIIIFFSFCMCVCVWGGGGGGILYIASPGLCCQFNLLESTLCTIEQQKNKNTVK